MTTVLIVLGIWVGAGIVAFVTWGFFNHRAQRLPARHLLSAEELGAMQGAKAAAAAKRCRSNSTKNTGGPCA